MNQDNTNNPEQVEESENTANNKRRTRRKRPFPPLKFEEALVLATAIQEHAAGRAVRRLTLLDKMGYIADSNSTRQIITASFQYGLTIGSYNAESFELTSLGKQVTGIENDIGEKTRARIKAGILDIKAFKFLFDSYSDAKVPSKEIIHDKLRELKLDEEYISEGVEIFLLNCKFLGLITIIAGAERIVTVEQAIDNLKDKGNLASVQTEPELRLPSIISNSNPNAIEIVSDWTLMCFYISPIGEDLSEQRKHSDLFLSSIIEPALEEFKFSIVRADRIAKPGIITKQIIEYILQSKLVIADLSFHNPNVFYELSLRHVIRKPIVQVIRKSDKIPFDLDQYRTIEIDTTDIYTLVPNLQSYKTQIANQVRNALNNPDLVDSPISIYYPSLKVTY